MFHELVSRNEDLKRLVDKGYAIKFGETLTFCTSDEPLTLLGISADRARG